MSDDGGKASAKAAVESLVAQGVSDVGGGLLVAADVLDGRRHRNAVAGVILLSDGHDNVQPYHCLHYSYPESRYSELVPRSLSRTLDNQCPPPVHAFVLGSADDHSAASEAMHAVAESTAGTLTFIDKEDEAAAVQVQGALADCIGGLRAVAVQEARVAVECLHPGVHVRAVKVRSAGRCHRSFIGVDGRAALVDVGELCAGEESRFLLFLGVPVAKDDDDGLTRLVKVSCTYKDAVTGGSVRVSCEDDAAVVRRTVVVSATATGDMDESSCVEVARGRFRVEAAEDTGAARAATSCGEHARAAQILDRRLEASAAAELVAELRELSARVAHRRREYEQTGAMSSHTQPQQRESTAPLFGTPVGSTFGGFPFGASSSVVAAAAQTAPAFGRSI